MGKNSFTLGTCSTTVVIWLCKIGNFHCSQASLTSPKMLAALRNLAKTNPDLLLRFGKGRVDEGKETNEYLVCSTGFLYYDGSPRSLRIKCDDLKESETWWWHMTLRLWCGVISNTPLQCEQPSQFIILMVVAWCHGIMYNVRDVVCDEASKLGFIGSSCEICIVLKWICLVCGRVNKIQ